MTLYILLIAFTPNSHTSSKGTECRNDATNEGSTGRRTCTWKSHEAQQSHQKLTKHWWHIRLPPAVNGIPDCMVGEPQLEEGVHIAGGSQVLQPHKAVLYITNRKVSIITTLQMNTDEADEWNWLSTAFPLPSMHKDCINQYNNVFTEWFFKKIDLKNKKIRKQ